MNIFKLD